MTQNLSTAPIPKLPIINTAMTINATPITFTATAAAPALNLITDSPIPAIELNPITSRSSNNSTTTASSNEYYFNANHNGGLNNIATQRQSSLSNSSSSTDDYPATNQITSANTSATTEFPPNNANSHIPPTEIGLNLIEINGGDPATRNSIISMGNRTPVIRDEIITYLNDIPDPIEQQQKGRIHEWLFNLIRSSL